MASEEGAAVDARQQQQSVEWFKYSKRVVLRSIVCREDKGLGLAGERAVVGGWVRSRKEKAGKGVARGPRQGAAPAPAQDVTCGEVAVFRVPILRSIARILMIKDEPVVQRPVAAPAKREPVVAYLRINDGSCIADLQIVVHSSMSLPGQDISIGTSVLVEGVLEKIPSPGRHVVQLKVEKILHVGIVDLKKYPLAETKFSFEFLRAYPHLRPRTSIVASVTRIRNILSYATHKFFQNNGFLFVHMPIITTTDSRVCSKMFHVTTLFSKSDDMEKLMTTDDHERVDLEVVKAAIKDKSKRIEELKRSDSNREALLDAQRDLQKANELALQLDKRQKSTSLKIKEVNFSNDFFSRPAYLSFSTGLHLESYACALSSVYTFGPIFQADDSQSPRNLAEMWMVEVELAFAELEDAINCVEDYLKFLCRSILESCSTDIKFMSKYMNKDCIGCLKSIGSSSFARITYAEALEILKEVKDHTFETKVEQDLSEEHESYLADKIYKRPVIIYEHPKEVKPFYMHVRDDGKTVSSFDIIAPKAGVLVRGSQREERIDMITKRIQELGLPQEQYDWYLDLRRHGTVKHSGFSLVFEKMVMFATGLDDIRDTIAFPRTHGSANT
ncbi:asparagine--tRNA ligase, cytoplasmic 2-like [Phoenix dactylifera]|uniref:Asparagine--tRNA ligase, cytoplasmic 2-like n=1 Tax=Phoenix dactylifera TaxID=42345 RepID=A0A8B7C6Y6_PHODC|nr:asparagine--tRNA ligase, cytoplasmic 2-like [Phoenix dactylifera]